MKKETTIKGNIFTTLLLIAFIVLKLVGVINWSWIWVLCPFWIPLGLALIVFAITIIIAKIGKRKI